MTICLSNPVRINGKQRIGVISTTPDTESYLLQSGAAKSTTQHADQLTSDLDPDVYYDSEIYAPATSGNGPLLCGLEHWSDWSFHFIGADATNNFELYVGGIGVASGQVAAKLTPVNGGADVTTVVAAGLYKLTNPMLFGDLRIVRSGAGTSNCRVIAIGRP